MTTMAPSQLTHSLPSPDEVYRFTVDQYENMVESGALREDDRVELVDGIVVWKMPKTTGHIASTRKCLREIARMLSPGWHVRKEEPVRIPDYDEPEPDLAVVRGSEDAFDSRLPGPQDVVLIVEVAFRSLKRDKTEKRESYGRAAIPVYWIVNLVDSQIEVYTEPGLTNRTDYRAGQDIPVIIDGQEIGRIAVADLLP
jgi:Putative restriction endonuclease